MIKNTKSLAFRISRFFQTESQFLQMWRQVSNDLQSRIEDKYADHPRLEDIEGNDQLLKISLLDGKTFIINRQTAKFEIWYSSPISGPSHFRFDTDKKQWINKSNEELYKAIEDDISFALEKKKRS
jgi:iron donor protein CyaY